MEKTFDNFKEACTISQKIDQYYVLALRGNTDKWQHDHVYVGGDERYKDTNSIKFRTTESDKMVDASVTVYNETTGSLSDKSLYRNSKGIYFKGANLKLNPKNVYIKIEDVPEHMK